MSVELTPALRERLLAIPLADVSSVPGGRKLLEIDAIRVMKTLDEARRSALAEIGYDVAQLDDIAILAEVFGTAKADAGGAQIQNGATGRAAAVAEGRALRDELVRACRYHLRHVAQMDIRLDSVADDTGAADLATDLDVLAVVITTNAERFVNDQRFDAAARADEARAMARRIREAIAMDDGRPVGGDDRDLRDRAAVALAQALRDLNHAVAYALPKDEDLRMALRPLKR